MTFTFLFLDLFLRITNKIIITKNQHQKQHVVWTAPFWIIADTFTASQGKVWTDPPPIFLNDLWHMVNYDLHIFVSWSFPKIHKYKNHHQTQNGKRWQGLKRAVRWALVFLPIGKQSCLTSTWNIPAPSRWISIEQNEDHPKNQQSVTSSITGAGP